MWGPNAVAAKNKFEPIQKRAIKWILGETNRTYNEQEYHTKLYRLDLLPLSDFFVVKKLKLFHAIVNETSHIIMPDYIIRKRNSRTADNSYNYAISSEVKLPIVRVFGSSFFPSCIELWNLLPNVVKCIQSPSQFLVELKSHIWQQIISKYELEPD